MALTLLRGNVYTPNEHMAGGAVLVEGQRIVAVDRAHHIGVPEGARVIDAEIIAPGFIDLQINGAFGHDFVSGADAIAKVAALLPATGVTSFLPTLVSLRRQSYPDLLRDLPQGGSRALGFHLEGPFLNPRRAGAHELAALTNPRADDLQWMTHSGLVRLVTLAPELPGALELTRALIDAGIRVAAGHSDATHEEARAALAAGVTLATHLFNAMPPLHHRAPGLAGAVLASERCAVTLIADGVHLHPEVVKLVHRLKPGLVALVTDAISGTLAGRVLAVDDTSARLPDGTLAGSILTMDEAVRRYRRFTTCTIGEALAAASLVPACALGIDGQRGRLAPGYLADIVMLDGELRVTGSLTEGHSSSTPVANRKRDTML